MEPLFSQHKSFRVFFVIAQLLTLALTLICAYTLHIKLTVEGRHKILQKINKFTSDTLRQ